MHPHSQKGFTLTELVIAVGIAGVISTTAIPQYYKQLVRTRQNECSAVMSQVLTSTMGFNDEFGEQPRSWADLNAMAAIMKESGTAGKDNDFELIHLSNHHYSLSAEKPEIGDSIFEFECVPRKKINEDFNVVGCLNLTNGASEINKGRENNPALEANCT